MSIHCVTLLFICHHLFPCTPPLSVPAWAHPLPAQLLSLGPVLWEKGGWLCSLRRDKSWGNETYSGTFEFPILFPVCRRVIRQYRDRDMGLQAVGKDDRKDGSKGVLPAFRRTLTRGQNCGSLPAEPKAVARSGRATE